MTFLGNRSDSVNKGKMLLYINCWLHSVCFQATNLVIIWITFEISVRVCDTFCCLNIKEFFMAYENQNEAGGIFGK